MNWGRRYDLLVTVADVLLRGTLRLLRLRAIDLADLQLGEAVLDVGCGTGTLAVLAQERVSPTGRVAGIDPGPRQIARARAKAARHQLIRPRGDGHRMRPGRTTAALAATSNTSRVVAQV